MLQALRKAVWLCTGAPTAADPRRLLAGASQHLIHHRTLQRLGVLRPQHPHRQRCRVCMPEHPAAGWRVGRHAGCGAAGAAQLVPAQRGCRAAGGWCWCALVLTSVLAPFQSGCLLLLCRCSVHKTTGCRLQALEAVSPPMHGPPTAPLRSHCVQGGATAAIPGAVLVNDCTGPDYAQTSGVAACSYIRVSLRANVESDGRNSMAVHDKRGPQAAAVAGTWQRRRQSATTQLLPLCRSYAGAGGRHGPELLGGQPFLHRPVCAVQRDGGHCAVQRPHPQLCILRQGSPAWRSGLPVIYFFSLTFCTHSRHFCCPPDTDVSLPNQEQCHCC